MGWIPERDSNGFGLFKNQVADKNLHYEPRSFDWKVGKHNSLYNRKATGLGTVQGADDYEDAEMKFYDSLGDELTQNAEESDVDYQARLTANCTMTDVIWNHAYNIKCIGANIQVLNTPTWPAYLWSFIDLSAMQAGQIPYLEGGWNLQYFLEKHPFSVDARTCDESSIPAGLPVVFRVRHDIVTDESRFGIQVFMENYRE